MDRPQTHYARSGELAIAYQVHGSGDRDLLVNPGPASNTETVWDIPEAARFFKRLGRFARVIRFDRRDTGLSDPIRDDLTLEAHADDALAVIEATDAEKPVLMGSLEGARSLALLAATRPREVGGLVAISPAVGGAASSPELAESVEQTFAELTWPDPQLLALWAPEWADDPVRADRLRRYFQTTVTPRQLARLVRMSLTSDIRDVLPLVQAPTLVLHPADLQVVPVDTVREFVDLIPGATYREVSGNSLAAFALDVEEVGRHHRGVRHRVGARVNDQPSPCDRPVHRPGRLDQTRGTNRGPRLDGPTGPPSPEHEDHRDGTRRGDDHDDG